MTEVILAPAVVVLALALALASFREGVRKGEWRARQRWIQSSYRTPEDQRRLENLWHYRGKQARRFSSHE